MMNKQLLLIATIFSFLIFLPHNVIAAETEIEEFRSTELPLPRFVSLRSGKVYARSGPALRYPIKWVYRHQDMPIEIIQEYDNWRKVRDVSGDEGWIHFSLLTGERTVLIKADNLVPMREGFSNNARVVARLEPNVIASIKKCADGWCKVEADGYHGWIERNYLWGIYEDEFLN
jgi:SH3-like domain-containing protein